MKTPVQRLAYQIGRLLAQQHICDQSQQVITPKVSYVDPAVEKAKKLRHNGNNTNKSLLSD